MGMGPAFEMLIEHEFLQDLKAAAILTSWAEEELSEEVRSCLKILKAKYQIEGKCPSKLFDFAPRHLQEEYRRIHKTICETLYNLNY